MYRVSDISALLQATRSRKNDPVLSSNISVSDHISLETYTYLFCPEDSEPLFGLWFESTLVAPDMTDNSGLVRATGNTDSNDNTDAPQRPHQAIVPDKAEPYSVSVKSSYSFTCRLLPRTSRIFVAIVPEKAEPYSVSV